MSNGRIGLSHTPFLHPPMQTVSKLGIKKNENNPLFITQTFKIFHDVALFLTDSYM